LNNLLEGKLTSFGAFSQLLFNTGFAWTGKFKSWLLSSLRRCAEFLAIFLTGLLVLIASLQPYVLFFVKCEFPCSAFYAMVPLLWRYVPPNDI
jgi:hypothetical protein